MIEDNQFKPKKSEQEEQPKQMPELKVARPAIVQPETEQLPYDSPSPDDKAEVLEDFEKMYENTLKLYLGLTKNAKENMTYAHRKFNESADKKNRAEKKKYSQAHLHAHRANHATEKVISNYEKVLYSKLRADDKIFYLVQIEELKNEYRFNMNEYFNILKTTEDYEKDKAQAELREFDHQITYEDLEQLSVELHDTVWDAATFTKYKFENKEKMHKLMGILSALINETEESHDQLQDSLVDAHDIYHGKEQVRRSFNNHMRAHINLTTTSYQEVKKAAKELSEYFTLLNMPLNNLTSWLNRFQYELWEQPEKQKQIQKIYHDNIAMFKQHLKKTEKAIQEIKAIIYTHE